MSLVTALREFKTIALTEFYPLYKHIIQPGITKSENYPLKVPKQFLEILNENLNPSQYQAIQKIVNKFEGITLLQGPPGTGKTHTILALIAVFLQSQPVTTQKPHVLVCAPSNCAVDEILYRVVKNGIIGFDGSVRNDVKVVRVGALHEEQKNNAKKDNDRQIHPENAKFYLKSLVAQKFKNEFGIDIEKTRKSILNLDRQIQKLSKKKNKTEKENQDLFELNENKKQLFNNLHQEKVGWVHLKDKKNLYEQEILNSADIVLCTCTGAGSSDIANKIIHNFDFVIIDEACQSVELQSLIPLQYQATHVVLVGDPQQLPATVFNRQLEKLRYNISLFQRLMEGGQDVIMLQIQYRMESIIRK